VARPLWIGGVLLFHVRNLLSWIAARQLRHTGVCCPPDHWQGRLERLCARLRLSRPVTLLESCLADVPVVIGYLRPVILMPVGLIAGLSAGQVEAILLHELAHIRRHDYLVNLLQIFVEGLGFYHPAVWWISGVIRAERENCCDDLVVAVRGDAYEYAAALAALEQNRGALRDTVLAATGGSLVKRVRRLLTQPEKPRAALSPVFSAVILTLTVVVAMSAWQTRPVQRSVPRAPELPATAPPVAAAPAQEPPVKLLAQSRPAPAAAPQTASPADGLTGPYRRWLIEDVAYIISDEERAAYKSLQVDAEREHFIEQFWMRRDPTPGTDYNEFKAEHYRRIAYTNEHFATANNLPGWKTDRGRIYIVYGPPDEKESHPSGGAYRRPAEQGGGTITTVPFEEWLYRHIEGVGNNVVIEFVDPTASGEYRMTTDPAEKDAQNSVASARANATQPNLEQFRKLNLPPPVAAAKAGATIQARGSGAASISVPLSAYGDHRVKVAGRILTMTGRLVTDLGESVQGPAPLYNRVVVLPAGVYRFQVMVTDMTTGKLATDNVEFEVK